MGKRGAGARSSPRLTESLANRDNNFDVLRLAAAVLVMVSHAVFLSGHEEPVVPLTDELIGDSAVLVFFAISGFLVTRSWLNDPKIRPFAVKRVLRIFPGLIVSLVLLAYVLGPLLTSDNRVDYVTSTGPAKYVVGHTLMFSQYSVHGRLTEVPNDALPGVFEANPTLDVNGSLWTLPLEITAYLLLALAGLVAALRRGGSASALAAVVLVAASGFALWAGSATAYTLFAAFGGGAFLYLVRERVPLSGWLFVAAVGLWIASYQLPLSAHVVVTALTVPYAVIFLGFRGIRLLRPLTRPGDLSYGIYIYAWPVQQAVIQLTGTRSPAVVLCIGGVATYLLALASWRAVERPALRLKGRRSSTRVEPVAEGVLTGR